MAIKQNRSGSVLEKAHGRIFNWSTYLDVVWIVERHNPVFDGSMLRLPENIATLLTPDKRHSRTLGFRAGATFREDLSGAQDFLGRTAAPETRPGRKLQGKGCKTGIMPICPSAS